MTDQSVTPDQQTDLPSMLSGIKWFKGSAGLAIAWRLDTESRPPSLVCTLFTRAPNDELGYVPPLFGTTTIRLTPWSGAQLFQLKRQPLPGEVAQPSDGALSLQTHGLIYLGGLQAAPDDISGNKSDDAPLFLHVHCRVGATSGFRTRIARGTYGQFIETLRPAPTNTAAEKTAAPAPSASPRKRSSTNRGKARPANKRSR